MKILNKRLILGCAAIAGLGSGSVWGAEEQISPIDNSEQRVKLITSILGNNRERVRCLIHNNEEIDNDFVNFTIPDLHCLWTPLHWAAWRGYTEICRILIHDGADIEAHDKLGRTPLCLAASGGHGEIVEELIGGGAEVDIADRYGRTPISFAALGGHSRIVKQLNRAMHPESPDVE
jgi:ankyrin repeat protein